MSRLSDKLAHNLRGTPLRLIAWALAAACWTSSAFADSLTALPPPETQAPPLSVWRLGADGDAEHLQSGLACPALFHGYKRVDLHVYDGFGLDVSCNYTAPDVILTLYMTRRTGAADVDAAMEEARREFLGGRADWHPQLSSDTRPTIGAIAWHVLVYGDDQGRDGIWIADLDGWTLEFRITDTIAADGHARSDIAAMTQMVVRSAGARLDLCAKSSPPDRHGVPVKDGKDRTATALMSAATAAAGYGLAAPAPTPVTWCVEQPIHGAPADLLFWRGVRDDGTDAGTDELTAMTKGPPPALMVANDPTTALIEKQLGRPSVWTASMGDGDQTSFYGYFTGRPAPETLAALFQTILAGKAHPISGYNAKGRSITIDLPSR
jgi:hypothetical protein